MGLKTKINHVAMSVPAAELDDVTRKELADFYGDVFGWIETVAEEEEGNPLILRMTEPTQFVYIYPEPGEAMKAPRLDHFGVEVATRVCQVWVDQGGRWRLAGIQFSPLAES